MEKIFTEIVHIMHNDYAGCNDKLGWDRPEYFLQKLRGNDQLSHEEFKQIVEEYLLDFNDKHIHFIAENVGSEKPKNRGFKVRRFEDHLYVTEVDSEERLKPGMSFVSIGGYSIPELKERHHRLLNENHPERENWMPILMLYNEGEIVGDNGRRTIPFRLYEKKPYIPTYSVEERDGVAFITMSDFANPDAILKMLEEHQQLLEKTDKWIIDVRVNYGGSDSSFYPFIPYLMPEEGVELADPENKMLFNCTEASTDRILSELEEALASTEDEQARWFLTVFKREWERNRGKGFVEFDFGDLVSGTFVKGSKHPSSVIVLADVFCGSSGDSFVEGVKKSNKVTVIGRATMGLNDYANLVSMKWEEGFELMYPSSRLSRIDKGEGMTGVGITPHIHIPWTPEHIDEDIDIKKAFELLQETISK
ncbi:S41 family peptidase [Sporosarcina sp. ACRSL]|uniref:S41 family peptidase n=1 Tax=Sporosarcina sp. ACRSL TaxID=2918215 RepID=UPI001EF4DA26|nr:S41 family peptidase [Sporosarcina sp. ACRSL]MCG7346347.1 S41 family peptidase [Sporosarcina sp. ACRSL]